MAYLEALNGSQTGQHYPLEGGEYILGRHPDCAIVLESGAVSRQHARIIGKNSKWHIEDLKSRNGTFVNGQLLNGSHSLLDGELIRICDLEFAFRDESVSLELDVAHVDAYRDSSSIGVLMVSDSQESATRMVTDRLKVEPASRGLESGSSADRRLAVMIDIAQRLSRSVALEDVLPKVLDSLFQLFTQADRGFIILKDARGELIPRWMKARRPDLEDTLRMSKTIMRHVMEEKQAIISLDASNDERFNQAQSVFDLRLRSVIIAPLLNSDEEPIGALYLDTVQQRSKFERNDLELLAAVAASAGVAIDNAQLHEQIVQQAVLDQDLKLARHVQLAFLPKSPPQLEGFRFYQYYSPANWIGGDYFDYIPLDRNRCAVVVADVVGHGVAAAMFMAKLSAETRFALAATEDLAAAMQRLNRSICDLQVERFVTMVVVVLDRGQRQIKSVLAGHSPPMVRSGGGEIREVGAEAGGFPLGIMPEAEYGVSEDRLDPGERLLLYTDGIYEAPNSRGEQFSIARIREMLRDSTDDCETVGGNILRAVREHVGDCDQEDDMCLVLLERTL